MVFEFKLPDVGEGTHEAEILAIKVREGDMVKEYQPMFDVETDKAVVEITSPFTGVVEKISVKVGDMAKVGTVMITFSESSVESETKSFGRKVSSSSLPSAASTASSSSSAAPAAPEKIPVRDSGHSARAAAPAGKLEAQVAAAPATRRLARELGVDLQAVIGSGPAGRVTREDIHAFAEGAPGAGRQAGQSQAVSLPGRTGCAGTLTGGFETAPVHAGIAYGSQDNAEPSQALAVRAFDLPDFTKFGPVERVSLRSLRKRIAVNMMQSWTHVPHVAHFDQIDITDMDAYRARHEAAVAQKGGKLTLTVLALKALATALKKYPQFNASLDEKASEIIYKRYYNIGVAVATERGLIVPVIRDVDKKSLVDLSIELADIAQKTRDGKIELERLQGGTFTVTNIGAIGGTGMMPLVNYPEVAIFGMARAKMQPVVRDGQIIIRNIMNVTLSFDHRVADGAEAAYFVRHVIECLEDPFKLLLEA